MSLSIAPPYSNPESAMWLSWCSQQKELRVWCQLARPANWSYSLCLYKFCNFFLFGSLLWIKHKLNTAASKWPLASDPLASLILNTIAFIAKQRRGLRRSATDCIAHSPEFGDWLLFLWNWLRSSEHGNRGIKITQAQRSRRTMHPCSWCFSEEFPSAALDWD